MTFKNITVLFSDDESDLKSLKHEAIDKSMYQKLVFRQAPLFPPNADKIFTLKREVDPSMLFLKNQQHHLSFPPHSFTYKIPQS